ncbi:MAG: DUF2905 domain-containing protein [Dehalococcoidia bacterium]
MEFQGTGKILVLAGIFLLVLGLLFIFWQRIPLLGRLPGDIFVQNGNLRLFLPIATCVVISIVLTIILNFVLRLFR